MVLVQRVVAEAIAESMTVAAIAAASPEPKRVRQSLAAMHPELEVFDNLLILGGVCVAAGEPMTEPVIETEERLRRSRVLRCVERRVAGQVGIPDVLPA